MTCRCLGVKNSEDNPLIVGSPTTVRKVKCSVDMFGFSAGQIFWAGGTIIDSFRTAGYLEDV